MVALNVEDPSGTWALRRTQSASAVNPVQPTIFSPPAPTNANYVIIAAASGGCGMSNVAVDSGFILLETGPNMGVAYIVLPSVDPTLNPAWTTLDPGGSGGSTGAALMEGIGVAPEASPPVITCPPLGSIQVSAAYSSNTGITGGVSPFTFSVVSGVLPPGLTINSSTGTISGTPTTVGTYNFALQVEDAQGTTAETAGNCTIVVTPLTPVVEPTGSCRTLLHLWQSAVAPQVEIITDRNDDWTDCGDPGLKYFQGYKLDGDTFGVSKDIQIRDADTGNLHVPQPTLTNHPGRQRMPYSFGTPFLAHMVRRESLDKVPWRKFGITYVWEPSPEFTYTWKTQRTSHGLSGFHHVQRMLFTYAANGDVILTVTAFDGVSPAVVTLPTTGGIPQKVVVVFTFNKGLLYQYSAISTASFQIWKDDLEVIVGDWGRQGAYNNYPLLGGNRGDSATI